MKRDKKYMMFSLTLALSQAMTQNVYAEEISYSGTSQISTDSYYLDIDTFAAKLVVEEVYTASGDVVSEGDKLLKFTDESYQNAVAYYRAALIKANNNLTDTQREYDNGILETQNTYDIAIADSENAEFIRDYQTAEVENALKKHKEIIEDIQDRVDEIQEGIDAGSYETSTVGAQGGSGFGGTGSSAGGELSNNPGEETPSNPGEETPSNPGEETPNNPGEETPSNPGEETPEKPNEDIENVVKQIQELETELTEKSASLKVTLEEVLQSVLTENDNASSDYYIYSEQLNNIIAQLETDIIYQKNVRDVLSEENAGEKEILENSIAGDEGVLGSLKEVQEKLNKYSSLISMVLKLFPAEGSQTVTIETEILKNMTNYMSQVAELTDLYSQLITLYKTDSDTLKKQLEEEKKKETPPTEEGVKPEEGNKSEEETPPTGGNQSSGGGLPDEMEGSGGTGMPSMGGSGNTGMNVSSMAQTAMPSAAGNIGQEMMNGVASLDGSDISILGNTYDLSNVETLLEREPSDSEAAEELMDELKENQEDVQVQYEELLRKEKAYELQIQYTYDEAILSGKLAEITYEQQLKEWEDKLQSAKDNITSLEEEQKILTTCADGILLADRSGTLAAVNYSAEDTINPMTAIASYYKTDEVFVEIQVPQEEIAILQVGDKVEVKLGNKNGYEGVVSEKAMDPDSNTSKTDIKYTVTISIDNEEGKIRSGTAATVTRKNETGEDRDEE